MFIYKQYTQETLNRQYNNRQNAPDHERDLQRWELLSRETEKKYPPVKNIAYGQLPDEKLDIFPSKQAHSKTLVYIHGGYWYKHVAADFYLIAEAFRPYGFTTVVINYPLMPIYSLDQLVLSCRRSIDWVQKNIAGYNGDPGQIYVAGHSAGGHLASMIMTGEERGMAIKAVFAISGLYNLLPVRLSYVNETIQLDKEAALRNSPVNVFPTVACPLLLAVGANESAEYLQQSRELYNSWSQQNAKLELLEIPGADHFSILETMLVRSSPLHKAMCRVMDIS